LERRSGQLALRARRFAIVCAAAAWLERLETLETRLSDKGIRDIANQFGNDSVSAERLRKGRAALLPRIEAAKKVFRERSR
jgi:hypothetical protein